ncbi:BON domain-containing protein [Lutimonas vermicola]|uniref:BON domain-containing protein n=1 Tax=Lutimonas vermicola TaxID=414288 RepID=A0ABU9KW75_9FLAO
MRTDVEIKEDVLDELAWEPDIDETQIGVIVENGVVTLSGVVDSYSKKLAAEKAVKRVKGVRAIAEDVEVKYGISYKKTDKEVAKAVIKALEWNSAVPDEDIKVKVEDGWVILSGEVAWDYQKKAAKKTVGNLLGVKKVVNNITLKKSIKPFEVKDRIRKAFARMANVDAEDIEVVTSGHTVTLKGRVSSLQEREDAEAAAYMAPDVYDVVNELKIQYRAEYA